MSLRSSYEACACVDDLGSGATGELSVLDDAGPRGSVFVENGRICWAAARGLARRLTELLAERAALSPEAMEVMFRECKAQHIPLGEHLLRRGVLDAGALREALLWHTVESLPALWQPGVSVTWSPRAESAYNAQFTFATGELLARAGARVHPALAEGLQAELGALFGDDGWAAGFVRSASSAAPVPVALVGRDPPLATALMRLGKWAASALDLTATFSDETALLSVERGPGGGRQTLVAMRLDTAVIAGATSEHGPARILNRRSRERLVGS